MSFTQLRGVNPSDETQLEYVKKLKLKRPICTLLATLPMIRR